MERVDKMTMREMFEYAAKKKRPLTIYALPNFPSTSGKLTYWGSVDGPITKCSKCGQKIYSRSFGNSGNTQLEAARNTMRIAFRELQKGV